MPKRSMHSVKNRWQKMYTSTSGATVMSSTTYVSLWNFWYESPRIQAASVARPVFTYDEQIKREPLHRHISHLYGVYPGQLINREDTPELMTAARKSMIARDDEGTGWSLAWKLCQWAHHHEGDHALAVLIEPFLVPAPDAQSKMYFYEDLFPKLLIIRRLAMEFADAYLPLDGLLAAEAIGREYTDISNDGVHPTPSGAQIIGRLYADAISPLIENDCTKEEI